MGPLLGPGPRSAGESAAAPGAHGAPRLRVLPRAVARGAGGGTTRTGDNETNQTAPSFRVGDDDDHFFETFVVRAVSSTARFAFELRFFIPVPAPTNFDDFPPHGQLFC